MAAESIRLYKFGDFYLDIHKRLLLGADSTPVSLAPKAYDTLAYLVQHAGAIVDKEELLRAIWLDTVVEENNLAQNVSQLRRVLGEGRGEHRYIATVPGRGYQFVANVRMATENEIKRAAPSSETSIAVLPFANFSGNPEFEYFCDGLAEELISRLSKLPRLRVAARTSAFSFKGKQADIHDIAEKLNVRAVLEGGVRKSGNHVRITAQLINAADGYQLWSERYDRQMELREFFEMQDEITLAVVHALRPSLAGGERSGLLQHHTADVQAQELYLKGRFHLFRMTPSGIESGLSYFRQAIESDPSDAVAHVGLAHAYRMFALTLEQAPGEALAKAKSTAEEAVRLNRNLAEAHAVLAFNIFWHEWAWSTAEKHFLQALELNPNSADTRWMYAHLLSNTGHHEHALFEIERSRELDPLSGLINAMAGQFLLHAGETDQAINRLREAVELDPNSRVAHVFAASAYVEQGRFNEAIAETHAARALSPYHSGGLAVEAYARAKLGDVVGARLTLDQLLHPSHERYLSSYNIAIVYNGLGEQDEALTSLERGFDQHDPWMVFLQVDPKWKNLRHERRYQMLLKRMNF